MIIIIIVVEFIFVFVFIFFFFQGEFLVPIASEERRRPRYSKESRTNLRMNYRFFFHGFFSLFFSFFFYLVDDLCSVSLPDFCCTIFRFAFLNFFFPPSEFLFLVRAGLKYLLRIVHLRATVLCLFVCILL